MTSEVWLAMGLSVLLHVAWNLAARRTPARTHFLWWGVLGHLVVFGPASIYWLLWRAEPPVPAGLTLWLALTTIGLCAYFLGLGGGYRRAPVNLVYPVTRAAPVLIVALVALLVFGERPGGAGWAGLGLTVVGLGLLAWSARAGGSTGALPWLALAALGTTVYTLSDRAAVVLLPDLPSRFGYVSIAMVPVFVLLSVVNARRFGQWLPPARPSWWLLLLAALSLGPSYTLVIHVISFIPVAHAYALTNAGIVLAVLLALFWRGERSHVGWRLTAALVVVTGLSLVAFDAG